MRFTIIILLLLCSSLLTAQKSISLGFGTGVDAGLSIDKHSSYSITKNNTWSFGGELFSEIVVNDKISVYPQLYFTLINGEYKLNNTLGEYNPYGDLLSLENTGNIPTQYYYYDYLTSKSKGRTAHFTFGLNVTRRFIKNLELGGGVFYTSRRNVIKDYMGQDTYLYYGSTGTHTSHYQTDEYEYQLTEVDNRPSNKTEIIRSQFEVSFLAKYLFVNNNNFRFGPTINAFIGSDIFFVFRFSFNFKLYTIADEVGG